MPVSEDQTAHLRTELAGARSRTDELFRLLRPDALYDRPVPERHRLIFYLGHVEAFDWNMVCKYDLSIPSFHPVFDELFAFGIDPDASGLPTDVPSDWPSLSEVEEYNRRVKQTVDERLEDATPKVVHVAIEHRLMHAETLAYLLHNLPLEKKAVAATPPSAQADTSVQQLFVEIPGGKATLGQPRDGSFGWDNEFEETVENVAAFSIARHNVTNGEYLRFVEEGGAPSFFWKHAADGWRLRTMFDEIPLPLDWPVFVTHTQATQYAQWTGKRLPSEAQIQRAAYGTPGAEEREYPWGSAEPGPSHGNLNFQAWDPAPVNAYPAGDSAFGVSQLLGNGWEWTRDLFRPLPGFEQFDFYPGYSANFFDDDHYVLKGASPRTATKLARRSFRNWFRKEYQYLYATFRCVED
jgi:formylglycine-generating enzyme required for sulfatase activity